MFGETDWLSNMSYFESSVRTTYLPFLQEYASLFFWLQIFGLVLWYIETFLVI